jgi:hypothetical protein
MCYTRINNERIQFVHIHQSLNWLLFWFLLPIHFYTWASKWDLRFYGVDREEHNVLWCDTAYYDRSLSAFWRNVLPLFRGQRVSRASKEASGVHSEDGNSMFLVNTSKLIPDYMTSHPRRQYSSWTWKSL